MQLNNVHFICKSLTNKNRKGVFMMKRKSLTKKLYIMSVGLLLVACAGNTSDRKSASDIKADNIAKNSVVSNTSGSEQKTQYPLTVTTYGSDGKELKTVYAKAPEKVLAVYQGSIETLLALGLESKIIAGAGLDNAVPENQKAAFSSIKYLDNFTPTLEEVTLMQPDLIFSWGSLFGEKTLGEAKAWVDKGTNVYINTNTRRSTEGVSYPRTLENEYTDILTIGKIFDVQSKAEGIVNDMKNTIKRVVEKTKNEKTKQKVLVVEHYKGSFTNYGTGTLAGDMVMQLGAELSNPSGSELGKEDMLKANPNVIFAVYMPYAGDDEAKVKQSALDALEKDPSLASLEAVKNKRIVPIKLSEMYASATRTKDGIVTFAKGLYPQTALGLD